MKCRPDGGGSRDLELERLRTVMSENILTSEVKRNGIGDVDPARLDRSIDQVAEDFKFPNGLPRRIFSTIHFCRRRTAA